MCSLVEIKNINEITIHYLHHTSEEVEGGNTSDLADSIESQDNGGGSGGGDVTINNCAVVTPIPVHTSDMAVQVEIVQSLLPQNKEEEEKTGGTSAKSIGGFITEGFLNVIRNKN